MADEKKTVGVKSVLAFLFLPQFRMSFNQLSIVKPIFMRTIASLLEGAGLLRLRHPATFYGTPGVPKYTFFELMGEAYYNLKKESVSNPYKWSVFLSIVAMTFIIFASLAMTVFSLAGVFVTTANAQLFDHISGLPTGMDSVPREAGGGGFNMNVASLGEQSSSVDYGIMILNKLFREGIVGSGGSIQRSFGSLMQIFNSAVLMIAGIMLFWAIISIVVDAAKTGQVGGGRHNLVWAPIRIVFALGLLIPLGSSGFSSGQLMVIKLAEWGSNLGTRAWTTYVKQTVGHYDVIAEQQLSQSIGIIESYVNIWTCRAAFNGTWKQLAGETEVEDKRPWHSVMASKNAFGDNDSMMQIKFGNGNSNTLCGKIIFPNPFEIRPPQVTEEGSLTPGVAKAIYEYKMTMLEAFMSPFISMDAATKSLLGFEDTWGVFGNMDNIQGTLTEDARDLGCMLASTLVAPPRGDDSDEQQKDPLAKWCPDGYAERVGAEGLAGTGTYRYLPGQDVTVIKKMRDKFIKDLKKTYEDATEKYAKAIKKSYDDKSLARGWPAMSMWYMNIAGLNQVVAGVKSLKVTITPPDYLNNPKDAEMVTNQVSRVFKISAKWWEGAKRKLPTPSVAYDDTDDPKSTTSKSTASKSKKKKKAKVTTGFIDTSKEILSAIPATVNGMDGFMATIISACLKPIKNLMGFSVNMSNTYPLAEMATIGFRMEDAAMNGYALITIMNLAGAGFDLLFSGKSVGGKESKKSLNLGNLSKYVFDAITKGPIGTLVTSISHALLMGSFMYSYYIPMLPFLKVAMAVLTWVLAVFEAVVMLPLAALSHITTTGDGLVVDKMAWVIWMNLLFRPLLTVIGFVSSMIVLQTMVIYVDSMWAYTINSITSADIGGGKIKGLSEIAHLLIYVSVMYTIINSTFKLIDIIPAALGKYMGSSTGEQTFDAPAMSGMSAQFQPIPPTDGRNILEKDEDAPDSAGVGGAPDKYENRNKGLVGKILSVGGLQIRDKKPDDKYKAEVEKYKEDKKNQTTSNPNTNKRVLDAANNLQNG